MFGFKKGGLPARLLAFGMMLVASSIVTACASQPKPSIGDYTYRDIKSYCPTPAEQEKMEKKLAEHSVLMYDDTQTAYQQFLEKCTEKNGREVITVGLARSEELPASLKKPDVLDMVNEHLSKGFFDMMFSDKLRTGYEPIPKEKETAFKKAFDNLKELGVKVEFVGYTDKADILIFACDFGKHNSTGFASFPENNDDCYRNFALSQHIIVFNIKQLHRLEDEEITYVAKHEALHTLGVTHLAVFTDNALERLIESGELSGTQLETDYHNTLVRIRHYDDTTPSLMSSEEANARDFNSVDRKTIFVMINGMHQEKEEQQDGHNTSWQQQVNAGIGVINSAGLQH